MTQIEITFNKYFTDKNIKPLQLDIIKNLILKKNVIAILPTGYGKSMCYQIPFLMNQNKNVIIVSPLISLMIDQKDKLESMNIDVFCFNSNVSNTEKIEMRETILNSNKGMLLYFTPEYISKSYNFIKELKDKDKLSLIAIDEAHCVSTWGNDFRPDYKRLTKLKSLIADIPILALTATANKKIEDDIKNTLHLKDAIIFKTSFDRPNLFLNVIKQPNNISDIFYILDQHKEDFSIIYCKTRKTATNIYNILIKNKYNANVYHAGLSVSERSNIQNDFSNKKINIIVATVAFGMGIDKNIHLVIHWGCPSSMESYYQEIGRAGRDGLESECYLFYSSDDSKISRLLIKDIEDDIYRQYRNDQISLMEKYCNLPICKRKIMLEYFDENIETNCNKCNYCIEKTEENNIINKIILYPVFIILKTIMITNGKVGANKIILICKGSKSKLINTYYEASTFGLLRNLNDNQIKNIINILIFNDYIKELLTKNGYGNSLEITEKSLNWIKKIKNIKLLDYDNLNFILLENFIQLNIPSNYNNLKNISFDSILQLFD